VTRTTAAASPRAEGNSARQRLLSPARLPRLLSRLGPTYIKVGQFLALRPDLIPQEYCDELLQLVDRVPPFPWTTARAIIEADLGADVSELFAFINPVPVAAASLAQVHLARTHTGIEVAVKVQREDLAAQIETDLRRTRWLIALLRLSGAVPTLDPAELYAELRRWLYEEIDARRELRNLQTMHDLSRDDPHVRVPRPYPSLSGARVVTADFLRGVPFSLLLEHLAAGHPERVAELGLSAGALADRLLTAVLTQIFRYGTFHADTHPGNLVALDGNRIGFVDFGLIGTLDPTVRARQANYIAAVYRRDVEGMYRAILEILARDPSADIEGFRQDFLAATHEWLSESATDDDRERGERSSVARYLVSVMRAARRNALRLPADALLMYRTLLTAETVANRLSGSGLLEVGRGFFIDLQVETAIESMTPDHVASSALDVLTLMKDGPGQVQRLLSDIADGRFELHVNVSESASDRRAANTRALLVAAAILSIGPAALLAGGAGSFVLAGDIPSWLPLLLLLFLLYGLVIILWRRLS
jgi:ubiquinone biosynthesis protein